MSSSGTGTVERPSSRHTHRDGSLEKKREIEKNRRKQQISTEEARAEALPHFESPRKITAAERQDSLTRNIANVLGDPGVVSGILSREPNKWFGTSRTGQVQTNLGQMDPNKTSTSAMQHSEKSGSSDHASKARTSTDGSHKSDNRHGERKNPRLKPPRATGRLDNAKPSMPSSRIPYKTSTTSGSWSQSDNRPAQHSQPKEDLASAPTVIDSNARERVSSIDSDMMNGVENILKEMVAVPKSISGIETPSVNDNRFLFATGTQKKKLDGPTSSMDSEQADDGRGLPQNSYGFDDDAGDNNSKVWLLGNLMSDVDARNGHQPSGTKRKSNDTADARNPKIPHIQSSKSRPKTTSVRTGSSPRLKPSAPAESNSSQRNLTRTPNFYENYPTPSYQNPSSSKEAQRPQNVATPPNRDRPGRPDRPGPQRRSRARSESSSSSSDSSSSGNSDDSDSDDSDVTEHATEHDKRDESPASKKTPFDANPVKRKAGVAEPRRPNRSPADITVKPGPDRSSTYSQLWVKIRADAIGLRQREGRGAPTRPARPGGKRASEKRPLVSVGSETEQPFRRAKDVEVAVAQPSDWKDGGKSKIGNDLKHASDKKNRRDDQNLRQPSHKSPSEELRNSASASSHGNASDSRGKQDSPNSSNRQPAPVVLPDSSLPGEQDRIETSDYYMRKGKKMKHEGDNMVDPRTRRTRPGEALSRALAYFEASLFFIMSGYVMENENPEDRTETSSQHSLCPANMYQQTLPFLDYVLNMRPHAEQEGLTFKQIIISCLRCQSFLYYRIFHLKKDTAVKNAEILTKHFDSMKSAQTHSPWRNSNAAPNVLSPMSPAVPSPFTHRGRSPASSNTEQVSSSTQAGRMTPTSHGSLPQKTCDIYRQHHATMCNLLQAHEKWDLAERMLPDHADFFRNIDALSNISLTFHSSLRHVFLYYNTVLCQLRTRMTNSPST